MGPGRRMSTAPFKPHIILEFQSGRYFVKTITNNDELKQAFLLRYQVFQVELIGHEDTQGIDHDDFDDISDHLAIFDLKSRQMVATCRLNCSLYSNRFYSEQEFACTELLKQAGTKLELGRVCVHKNYRKGAIILLLWRAIAEYMTKTDTQFLFGCGSVKTEKPDEAVLLYKYLIEENKMRSHFKISPTPSYASAEFNKILQAQPNKLSKEERLLAQELLPSLCRSYFDIGCYIPGPPAFDHDFKCIDFLTILESAELSPKIRERMMG